MTDPDLSTKAKRSLIYKLSEKTSLLKSAAPANNAGVDDIIEMPRLAGRCFVATEQWLQHSSANQQASAAI
jgi:hypothetical protein